MYGIVAPTGEEDQAALQRCPSVGHETGILRPPTTSASTATLPSIATSSLKDEIRLQPYGGVFAVPVVINGAVSIPFVLDSGAAEVQLPAEVVLTLIRTGTLSEGDFIGASSYVLADGSTLRSPRFRIREMRVGEQVVRNVPASIGPAVSSDALLGQSFLSKLPSWTLDNKRHVLILAR
jgi:predicted aspartyl protease